MVTVKMSDEFYGGRWGKANIPIKFRGIRLAEYSNPHTSGMLAREKAIQFVANFEDHYVSDKRAEAGVFPEDRSNIGRGLMLIGPNGTRKSTLACAILTEVQYRSPNYRVFYIRFSDWKKALTDTFSKEDSDVKTRAKQILIRAELSTLVVFDDVGQEHRTATGFTESSLHEFTRARHEAGLPTIITTNIGQSRIADTYGDSFDSFRYDAFDPLVIVGQDTRKTKD